MRVMLICVSTALIAILAGMVGHRLALNRCTDETSAREKQLAREMGLMLSAVVDIDEHRSEGQDELAAWKFAKLREGLESYLRGGGPDPTHFVPEIVEQTDVP
jgi:hypothetical protein